jgi:Rrf2 family protein
MRLQLTRRGDYAVRAMLALAEAGDRQLSAATIGAQMLIPASFVPQVMADLSRSGMARASLGRAGGYRLARPADQISLLEVIEAIEGPYDASLEMGDGLSEDSQHKLRDALTDVTSTTRRQLEAIKLATLLKPPQLEEDAPA